MMTPEEELKAFKVDGVKRELSPAACRLLADRMESFFGFEVQIAIDLRNSADEAEKLGPEYVVPIILG